MRLRPFLEISGLILLILIGYFLPELPYFKKSSQRYNEMYDAFYKAEVKGVILDLVYADHAILLKLKDGRSFVCTAVCGSKDLIDVADEGDSLIKHRQDEYFILKKQNGERCVFEMIDRRKPYKGY